MKEIVVEICCGSADDASRAQRAGADRIELNSAMLVGGLTPSVGMLQAAKRYCTVPIICMVRPRPGGFYYSQLDFETMLNDGKALIEEGADGLAFGCLDGHGRIDEKRCRQMAEIANSKGKEAVFHRAFDAMAQDHGEALKILISSGVQRVLTSGGEKTAEEGILPIKNLVELANGKIQILPGGGIRGNNVHRIIEETGVNQVHLSFHMDETDPSAGKNPNLRFSPTSLPTEEIVRVVDEKGLANFINHLKDKTVY